MKKVISFDSINPRAAERARKDQDYIDELAECYASQCELPPLDVFMQKGSEVWLADGLNRMAGAKKAGLKEHECTVHEGDYEDALLFAAGANNRHGSRPSVADKRKKVTELLKSKRWRGKSDRWIGDTCGVSHSTVGSIRSSLANSPVEGTERVGRDGRKYVGGKVKEPDAESNGEAEKGPKAGEEVFDFNAYHTARNTLRKALSRMYVIHKLVNANGSVKRDKEWDEIAKILEKFDAEFMARWAVLHGSPFPKQ